MTSVTLSAVVLPAGIGPGGRLRVNVYLSPRLSGAAHLGDFPDWLAWPELIQEQGLSVTLACGASTATAPVAAEGLRPDIWRSILPASTPVGDYPQPGYSRRLLVSYPALDAHDLIKHSYQVAATSTGGEDGRGLLPELLGALRFRDGQESFLDAELSQLRIDLWRTQQAGGNGTPPPPTPPPPSGPGLAPGLTAARLGSFAAAHAAGALPATTDAHQIAAQVALTHRLPAAPGAAPLPSTPSELARLLDFHRIHSVLAAHPSLLTALGLVLPLELPAGLCPPSPSGNQYLQVSVSALTPGWTWSDPPLVTDLSTSFVRSATAFAAAPATGVATLQSGQHMSGDVVDGFLPLDGGQYGLVDVELDGAMLKALSLADTVAFSQDSNQVEQILPALRSGGVTLLAAGRAQQVLDGLRASEAFEAMAAGAPAPRPLTARDLLRGYRLDVWSARTDRWSSLHRRDVTYRFGSDGAISLRRDDEEGFTQLAVMQPTEDPTRSVDEAAAAAGAPQPGTDLYVHERIARWNGWSLSAPRPGQPLNRSSDPAQAATPDPTAETAPFGMTAGVSAHPGSLPQLRFGDRYRMRVRTVDLAGHSLSPDTTAGDQYAIPATGDSLAYLRYEPVNPPLLVERTAPGPGGSSAQLVIRSRNTSEALNAVPTSEVDERHVAPPRAAVHLVEHHGMLDGPGGTLRADPATFELIVTRDRGQFSVVGDTPIEPAAQLTVPYFPDPLARGIAFEGLPGTSTVTQVPFGTTWPDREPLRIRLVEGNQAPAWDPQARVLTIGLPKGATADVALGCYVDAADLELLGVWNWIRELYEQAQSAALIQPDADLAVVRLATEIAELTALALAGGHEMITPRMELSLVHAVQQPLRAPRWERLPIVHRPEAPLAVPSVENDFWPLTAWRSAGTHSVVLLGALSVHGASTGTVEVVAGWSEWVDDPVEPGPRQQPGAAAVDRIDLTTLEGGPLFSDGTRTRMVAVYMPEVDALWFAAPFDALTGASTPTDVAAPVHNLGDTHHRCVTYQGVASSRFAEYFTEPGQDFTRTGDYTIVDVPSSARPLPPQVLYVVPTFGWDRQQSTNLKTEVRSGNGLRIYLDRPWYSSGDGELLGVVLWPEQAAVPDDVEREAAKQVITQWGLDPLWDAPAIGDSLDPVPQISHFVAATRSAQALTLDESAQVVDVAGHGVGYDRERRLWYCDVDFAPTPAYCPFVRLALARYQPSSISGVELSRVVLADFAQLAPDRSASLVRDPGTPTVARLIVGGQPAVGVTASVVRVSVERRVPGVGSDLGWEPAPAADAQLSEDAPLAGAPPLWTGTVTFAHEPAPGDYRLVVEEFEVLNSASSTAGAPPTPVERLVYGAVLPLDFVPRT